MDCDGLDGECVANDTILNLKKEHKSVFINQSLILTQRPHIQSQCLLKFQKLTEQYLNEAKFTATQKII